MKVLFNPDSGASMPDGDPAESTIPPKRSAIIEAPRPFAFEFRFGAVLWLALGLVLCGCAGPGRWGGIGWTDRHGVHHAVILGIGTVSFANGPVSAQDVRALGLVLDSGVSAGFVQKHRVEINPEQAPNAVVAIKTTPFGMTVKNFDFHLTNALLKPQLNLDSP